MKNKLLPYERFKLESGCWIGLFPYGYKVEPSIRTKYSSAGHVYIDEKEATILKDMFELYAAGKYSIKDLTKYLIEKYETKINRSSVHRILKNRFYRGEMTWKGYVFKHRYKRIISDELFDQAQIPTKKNTRYSLFTGAKDTIKSNKKNKLEFNKPFSSEEFMKKLNLSLKQSQQKLLNLELGGEIEEIGPNLWKIIQKG